jgi:uncharacterized membrane protein
VHKDAVHHTRLWLGAVAGVAIFFLSPDDWSFLPRVLTAWDGGVLLFLALAYGWMIGLDAKRIHARYQDGDPTAPVILLVVTVAALASLIAIVALLGTVKHVATTERLMHIGLATVTIVESWILVATMFTLHYANMFYRSLDQPPLRFPETDRPVFGDFLYFSFTIAAACQTADVSTTDVSIRRVVIFQTLISFLFNVSILGFALNVSAGLLGG